MTEVSEAPLDRRSAQKEDRRRAILQVAERSFFERGFAATTMSTIAAALGGSKTTLWSYFPSKEALFEAVLDSRIEAFATQLEEALVAPSGLRDALERFGRLYLAKILSPDSEALRRVMTSEAARVPEMAQAYYERGPARLRARLARYLGEQMDVGTLRRGDAMIAARQFLALCQAGIFNDRTWHPGRGGPDDVVRDVANALDTFLRAWGLKSGVGLASTNRLV